MTVTDILLSRQRSLAFYESVLHGVVNLLDGDGLGLALSAQMIEGVSHLGGKEIGKLYVFTLPVFGGRHGLEDCYFYFFRVERILPSVPFCYILYFEHDMSQIGCQSNCRFPFRFPEGFYLEAGVHDGRVSGTAFPFRFQEPPVAHQFYPAVSVCPEGFPLRNLIGGGLRPPEDGHGDEIRHVHYLLHS